MRPVLVALALCVLPPCAAQAQQYWHYPPLPPAGYPVAPRGYAYRPGRAWAAPYGHRVTPYGAPGYGGAPAIVIAPFGVPGAYPAGPQAPAAYPPGYAPQGYAPPGYASPGYAPQGYAPQSGQMPH